MMIEAGDLRVHIVGLADINTTHDQPPLIIIAIIIAGTIHVKYLLFELTNVAVLVVVVVLVLLW